MTVKVICTTKLSKQKSIWIAINGIATASNKLKKDLLWNRIVRDGLCPDGVVFLRHSLCAHTSVAINLRMCK